MILWWQSSFAGVSVQYIHTRVWDVCLSACHRGEQPDSVLITTVSVCAPRNEIQVATGLAIDPLMLGHSATTQPLSQNQQRGQGLWQGTISLGGWGLA